MIFDEVGDQWSLGYNLLVRGLLARTVGQYAQAEQLLRESLRIFEALGERWLIVYTINAIGRIARDLGRFVEAETRFEQSLQRRIALGDRRGTALTLNDLGDLARLQGKQALATRFYEQSQAIAREIADQGHVATTMWGLSKLAEMRGDFESAKQLILDSQPLRSGFVSDVYLGWAELCLGDLPAAGQHFQRALQLSITAGMLPIIVEALTGMAAILVQQGDGPRAFELLTLILDHPATHQEVRDRAKALQRRLKADLPPELVQAAAQRGAQLELLAAAKSLRRH